MSELAKCKSCKGKGYANRNCTKICDTCHGSGSASKKQRGYHDGSGAAKAGMGTSTHCVNGHLKTGLGVDDNGDIRTFCEICHNRVTNETKLRRREKAKK